MRLAIDGCPPLLSQGNIGSIREVELLTKHAWISAILKQLHKPTYTDEVWVDCTHAPFPACPLLACCCSVATLRVDGERACQQRRDQMQVTTGCEAMPTYVIVETMQKAFRVDNSVPVYRLLC